MSARRKSKQKRNRPQGVDHSPVEVKRRERQAPARGAEVPPLSRVDLGWAGAVAAASAVIFATTLNGHPALGDAPESVAGISSLGILHAPGYPAYVIAGWLFTLLVPFGSFAFQVNLFSLVCASLTVAGVYMLARRCGAERWAGAVGGLALACGAGFWFYADFAKHDAFSALAFIVALNLVLAWQADPSVRKLAATGIAIGIGLGSSWPLTFLLLPAIALVLLLERRWLSARSLATAVTAGVVVVIALYGFVMVRASQDPAVNWGDATTPERLISLVSRSDFTADAYDRDDERSADRSGAALPPVGALGPQALTSFSRWTNNVGADFEIFYNELGLTALVLAAWGLLVSLMGRRGPATYALLAAFGVNLAGAALIAGPGGYFGFDTLLVQEGFLLGCYLVLAVWLAIGATDLVAAAAEAGSPKDPQRQRAVVAWTAAPLIGLAVLVPSLIEHRDVQRRAAEPYADHFAERVFEELPRESVVFIFGAERTQPLVYRQVVEHDREDVEVVAAGGLSADWYREDLARRLGRELPPRADNLLQDLLQVIESLRASRPVYIDLTTARVLSSALGYRPSGLLARVAGPPGQKVDSPARFANSVGEAERAAGMPSEEWQSWPNEFVLDAYAIAWLEVARAYGARQDEAGVRRALTSVLRIDPDNVLASEDLDTLNRQGLPRG